MSEEQKLWITANQNLLTKSLGELSYEQILKPEAVEGRFLVSLRSGVSYRFKAWKSIWGYLRVSPSSIERLQGETTLPATDAGLFFIDAKVDLQMSDITLGNFLEEMQSTLFSDQMLLKQTPSVTEMSLWDGNRVQSALNGHPKILLNKGRMGWSANDIERYSPESGRTFRLYWLAVSKSDAQLGLLCEEDLEACYLESLEKSDLEELQARITSTGKSPCDYVLLPVHPWQWKNIIRLQFAADLAYGKIIFLGPAGDKYRPQISIRTLSNISRPHKADIKCSLSILNTSAFRGISARYALNAPKDSETISAMCESDSLLKNSNTNVLKDLAAVSYQQCNFSLVEGAPYRYHETLGAIWRQSSSSKLQSDELAVLTASLFHQDLEGRALISAYIERSSVDTAAWLKLYFEKVVIPLYHLQLKYGVGLVAHGQNIILHLKNFKPHGMFLKDFQGDLRITQMRAKEMGDELTSHLGRLPAAHLIHDLITGHFVTVLRFVSAALQESEDFPETRFYQILSETVEAYLSFHQKGPTPEGLHLLTPTYDRILLNKVRFQIGYSDSAERPLPALGAPVPNPLFLSREDR